MIDKMIVWFYNLLENKFEITTSKDKWLHFVILFIILLTLTVAQFPEYGVVLGLVVIVGREIFNVYQGLVKGYSFIVAFKTYFSLGDIWAGLLGGVSGLFTGLVLTMVYQVAITFIG